MMLLLVILFAYSLAAAIWAPVIAFRRMVAEREYILACAIVAPFISILFWAAFAWAGRICHVPAWATGFILGVILLNHLIWSAGMVVRAYRGQVDPLFRGFSVEMARAITTESTEREKPRL